MAGGCSYGPAQEVHPSRNGQSADGKEPVQGTLHGAPGGSALDRDDPSHQDRPQCGQEEQADYLEIVSGHSCVYVSERDSGNIFPLCETC